MRLALCCFAAAIASSASATAHAGGSGGGAPGWPLQIGSTDYDDGSAIAADGEGNVIVAGSYGADVQIGSFALPFETEAGTNARFNTYFAKLAPDGAAAWAQRLEDSWCVSLAVDVSGRTALGGNFNTYLDLGSTHYAGPNDHDGFVAVFDSGGALLWSRAFLAGLSSQTIVNAVAFDAAGDLFVAGQTYLGDFGAGPLRDEGFHQAFVAAYASDGSYLWAKQFGTRSSPLGARASSIAVDSSGNVIVTGQFFSDIDFGLGKLTTPSGKELDSDAFVAELDPRGNALWSKRFGGDGIDAGVAVRAGPNDSIFVAGAFSGTADFDGASLTGKDSAFVVQLDDAGNVVWRFGTQGGFGYYALWPLSLAPLSGGDVWLGGGATEAFQAGATQVTNAGGFDAVLAKLDTKGNVLSTFRGGDSSDQWVDALIASHGELYVSAPFSGMLSIRGESLTSVGLDDIAVLRLAP